MSQTNPIPDCYGNPSSDVNYITCDKEQCQLWTKAEVRNEQPGILRFEFGCAIQLIARKGLGNYIHEEQTNSESSWQITPICYNKVERNSVEKADRYFHNYTFQMAHGHHRGWSPCPLTSPNILPERNHMRKLRFTFNRHSGIWDLLPHICIVFQFKMVNIGWLCYTITIDWALEKTS